MATPRWYLVTSTLLAVVTAMGVLLLVQKVSPPASPRSDVKIEDRRSGDSTIFEVKFGRVGATINELGLVEPARRSDVFCRLEGQWTIISLIPEGTRVAKGQLVCELDSAALKDKLTNQYISTSGAEAAYQNAKLTREAAEVNVVDYQERVYKQESLAIAAEVASAEAAIRESEARRELARLARKRLDDLLSKKKDEWTPAEIVADLEVAERLVATESGLAREKAALEQAKSRQEIFEKSTRDKTIREIQSEIEKARTHELETKQAWDRERAIQAKLQFLLQNCKLMADSDGVVTYAKDRDQSGAETSSLIGEGSTVRERQKVFTISDLSGPMRITVKVPESAIEWVTGGLPARIRSEASGGESLPGTVEAVAPLPDPSTSANQVAKVYTTHVILAEAHSDLAPGMTTEVEIVTTPLEDVLCVPTRSVVYYGRADHVAVRKPDGLFDWRVVSLGRSDGTMVEVKDGLKPGETVSIEPASLLNQSQKRMIAISPPRPAPKPAIRPRLARPPVKAVPKRSPPR